MSKMHIELNSAGINELLHSAELTAQLEQLGNAAADRAGENFAAEVLNMPTRSVVRVSAINKDGIIENSRDNTLLKALYGG